ncbi:MAG: hypothetical protein ACPGRX_01925 [Bdellovibrionales bacterium]
MAERRIDTQVDLGVFFAQLSADQNLRDPFAGHSPHWPAQMPKPVVMNGPNNASVTVTVNIAGAGDRYVLAHDMSRPGDFVLLTPDQMQTLYDQYLTPITDQIIRDVNPITGEVQTGYADEKAWVRGDGSAVQSYDEMGVYYAYIERRDDLDRKVVLTPEQVSSGQEFYRAWIPFEYQPGAVVSDAVIAETADKVAGWRFTEPKITPMNDPAVRALAREVEFFALDVAVYGDGMKTPGFQGYTAPTAEISKGVIDASPHVYVSPVGGFTPQVLTPQVFAPPPQAAPKPEERSPEPPPQTPAPVTQAESGPPTRDDFNTARSAIRSISGLLRTERPDNSRQAEIDSYLSRVHPAYRPALDAFIEGVRGNGDMRTLAGKARVEIKAVPLVGQSTVQAPPPQPAPPPVAAQVEPAAGNSVQSLEEVMVDLGINIPEGGVTNSGEEYVLANAVTQAFYGIVNNGVPDLLVPKLIERFKAIAPEYVQVLQEARGLDPAETSFETLQGYDQRIKAIRDDRIDAAKASAPAGVQPSAAPVAAPRP